METAMSTLTTTRTQRGGIGFESAGIRLTPGEFDAITEYDELYRYELIDGVLVVNPIPSETQADPNDELGHMLRSYQEQHPQGGALDLTLPERYIHLPNSRRQADRVIWAGLGRRPNPKADVPAIAVEFVSAGRRSWRRDYLEKRREYEQAGVREYWVVDRFDRIMTMYDHEPGGPSMERVIREHETYRTDRLPGFELPLGRLLAVADAWRGAE